MSTSWIYKIDSGDSDERGAPVQYWFTYTVGTLHTVVQMATNKYWWKGEREDEVSGIMLEPVMSIEQKEPFLGSSESESWKDMCTYWMNKN